MYMHKLLWMLTYEYVTENTELSAGLFKIGINANRINRFILGARSSK